MNKQQGKANSRTLRGYVSHAEFGGFKMPATVQNLVMRDYVARNDYTFKLSVDEHSFENCYLQLYAVIDELAQVDGIVMCSAYMLPKTPARRRLIIEKALGLNAQMHFVFESLVVRSADDLAALEELFHLADTLKKCPTSIPSDLLGSAQGVANFS
jgi:sporadic carbohydrate cluster protein (TIGR04323 family)